MDLPSWTYSIEKTETSSAGVLQIERIKQWDLENFNTTANASEYQLMCEVVIEPNAFHFSLRREGATGEIEASMLRVRALIALLLFTQIPDDGLGEIVEAIGNIRAFYEPMAEEVYMSLPELPRKRARLKAPVTRLEFPISADEV